MFIDRLIENIKSKKSPVVVGLDPRIEMTPQFIKDIAFKKEEKTLKVCVKLCISLIKV